MKQTRLETMRTATSRMAGRMAALAVIAALWLAFATLASAQVDPVSCGQFETQEDAQAYFDENELEDPAVLDPDADGIACEFAFGGNEGPPAVVDPVSCGHFATQPDAQAALEARPELAPVLDANGNGVACEEAFPGVVVDPTSCGHFETREDAQAALDEGAVPNPENLDGDGDGIACEDAFDGEDDGSSEVPQMETIGLGIAKYNCPSAAAYPDDLASCELGAGVTFEVATADGVILGSCTTEITMVQDSEVAFCAVDNVGYDTPLVITEDVATGPVGFVPLENPQTMTIERPSPDAADFAPRVTFVNVPAVDEEPSTGGTDTGDIDRDTDTVLALPQTGTGDASATDAGRVAFMVLVAAACGWIGLVMRVRSARQGA
ncbi:MAG TPA: excalibur calcium-binding domain-containing protein [Thermomicrobiales bacterium]|nr:excalibur calcium-binding domain-containing protein [Thermomicrobiales bacterium]